MKTSILRRLPLRFTGIVITCLPDSERTKNFLFFKNGRMELGLWYESDQMPDAIKEWIKQSGFSKLKIFNDYNHIISRRDFEMLIQEENRQLTPDMDCVKTKK